MTDKTEDKQAEIDALKAQLAQSQQAMAQANQALQESGRHLDHANMANDGWRAKVINLQNQLQQVAAERDELRKAAQTAEEKPKGKAKA